MLHPTGQPVHQAAPFEGPRREISNVPRTPRATDPLAPAAVGMSHFVSYLGTAGEQRFQVVTTMDEPYSPFKDPYARMRRAIKNGRRTGQDHTHINLTLKQSLRG